MAKVVITITDELGDRVKVVSEPSAEMIIARIHSGHDATSAHGYAMAMLNAAQKESAKLGPTKILIPRKV